MRKSKLYDYPSTEEVFERARNNALFSFNEERIRRFCYTWGISCPKDNTVFWKGVYRAILKVRGAPDAVCAEAAKRLKLLESEETEE